MADEAREGRALARDQGALIALLREQLEEAQLEAVRLQRAAEVAPAAPHEGAPAHHPPPAFAFPTKVVYPELMTLTRKSFESFRLEYVSPLCVCAKK